MIRTVLEAAVALSSLNSTHTQMTTLQPEDLAITRLTLPFLQNTTCPNPDYSLELLAPRVDHLLVKLTHSIVGAATGMTIMAIPALIASIGNNNRNSGDSLLKIGAIGSALGGVIVIPGYNIDDWIVALPLVTIVLLARALNMEEDKCASIIFVQVLGILIVMGSLSTIFAKENLGIPGALSTGITTIAVILTTYTCLIKKVERRIEANREIARQLRANIAMMRQIRANIARLIPQQNQEVNWAEREFVEEEVRNGRNMIMGAGRVQAVIAPRVGSTPEDLERITNQMFDLGTRITSGKDTSEDKVCSICFSNFQKNQLVFSHDTANGVEHTFHSECIRDWAIVQLRENRTVNCPDCRVLFI